MDIAFLFSINWTILDRGKSSEKSLIVFWGEGGGDFKWTKALTDTVEPVLKTTCV